ncbi:hypothetical protein CL619_00590 [archaeon]|nr:hypothetical protein [archaeon]
MSDISAVIFDLNGVLVQSEYLSKRLERDYGVANDEVILTLKETMPKLRDTNAPSAWELWKSYIVGGGIDFSEQDFLDYWFSGEGLNTELVEYVKELKENGVKVFILSNNFKERFEYYQKEFSDLLDFVEKAYFSFQTGIVKPDLQAWKQILDEFNLKPEECLYIDDSNKNINAAQSFGIQAVTYSSVENLKRIIN